MDKWESGARRTLIDRRIFSLYEIDCYNRAKNISHVFSVIDAPDWINIVAETQDNKLIFVRQHRLGTDEMTIETTAGMVEPEEDPLAAAQRELTEETGYCAENMFLLKKLSANPAIMTPHIYFYYAQNCIHQKKQSLDPTEDIEVLVLSKTEVCSMLKDGRIDHSIIVSALSMYFMSPYNTYQWSMF